MTDRRVQGVILNNVGLALMSLGRLAEAEGFFRRSLEIKQAQQDWTENSVTYQNLAGLLAHRGELARSRGAAAAGLRVARKGESSEGQRNALAYEAWAAHLQGDVGAAAAAFSEATELERIINPNEQYLYGLSGLRQAEHLGRTGQWDQARQVTEANRESCDEYRWSASRSGCHRLLVELAAHAGQEDEAREHLRRALEQARSISKRDVLIAALSARGRWLARRGEAAAARRDLEEGLNYAMAGGYRIYEADLRVGLAWAGLKEGKVPAARQEAELALSMSREMGYHWGQVDAQEVLAACGAGAG